jgi:hypothetical protein
VCVQVRLELRSDVLFSSHQRTRDRISHEEPIAVVLNRCLNMPIPEGRCELPHLSPYRLLLRDGAADYPRFRSHTATMRRAKLVVKHGDVKDAVTPVDLS